MKEKKKEKRRDR